MSTQGITAFQIAAGVLIFRNTAPTLQLLAAWRLYLTDPSRKTATIGAHAWCALSLRQCHEIMSKEF